MKNLTLFKAALAFVVMSFILVACSSDNGKFVDKRDGKVYATTKIGKQVWMAQNLDYAMDGSYCYDNKPGNCAKYGRLYTWNTAIKACPTGWHLPTAREWDKLAESLGEEAGKKMKSKQWDGTDAAGFHVLPAGCRMGFGDFCGMGAYARFATATDGKGGHNADSRSFFAGDSRLDWNSYGKGIALSVRCLQD